MHRAHLDCEFNGHERQVTCENCENFLAATMLMTGWNSPLFKGDLDFVSGHRSVLRVRTCAGKEVAVVMTVH